MRRHLLWLLLALAVVLPARVGLAPTVAEAHVGGSGAVATLVGTAQLATSDQYGGQPRRFTLHVPSGLLAPAPLVLVLHGLRQDPQRIREFSQFEAVADRQGFVVGFPGGVGGSWNAGACCGPAARQGIDDLTFLDHVIAKARQSALIDPARIYITGYSNGAMMALRYACERPSLIAAVAVVAGSVTAPCMPDVAVAVLDLHGNRDTVVPLRGGPSRELHVAFAPVSAGLAPFATAGGEVALQVLPRATHRWMTLKSDGFAASDVLWDWLRDHPKSF